MNNIIEVNNVTFEYENSDKEHAVLKDFSIEIERGSFTVILGHNGSGKSTLAKLLNGLYLPISGTVTVDGMLTSDTENSVEIKRRVGLVFQNPDNQIVASVVEDDVAFGPENLGYKPQEIRKRVDEALKTVDMYDYRTFSPHNLSGGQKQRVAIAGILAMTPECIVLDEPTAMLDPKGRQEVIDTLKKLNKQNNITIVLITHFMEEVKFADRVIVMTDGKIIADGKAEDVFKQTEMLISAGLEIPQTTQLLKELSDKGLPIKNVKIGIDDCVNEIYGALKK